MMVVITIVGLALGASWGSMRDMMEQHRVSGATNQLATHLRLARERAVAEGNNFIVTFRTVQNDYQVWDDEGSDALNGPADVRRIHELPDRVVLRNPSFFGANRVTFRPDGTTDASGSLELVSGSSTRRLDILASTGKVTVSIP